MISFNAAWERLKLLPMFKKMSPSDFRPIVFPLVQTVAGSATIGPIKRDFPGGAIILGVTASATQSGAPAVVTTQADGLRSQFALDMAYSNDEQIVPGALLSAEALLGAGKETQFPPRELVCAPTQGINVRFQNLTSTSLLIHLGFHCMVWRFAS